MPNEAENLDPAALQEVFDSRLQAVAPATERRGLTALARELAHLPFDLSRAALETSALIAGVSLRASSEFLRAVPAAARALNADDLRAWGELGRRLAMSDTETAIGFFQAGVAELAPLTPAVRTSLWKIAQRQMTLSSAIAVDTLRQAPELARAVEEPKHQQRVFEVASEIAHRSAKHSADFLQVTPAVFAALRPFSGGPIADRALELAAAFAARAGGIATDAWSAMPGVLNGLPAESVAALFTEVEIFLERGGSVSLQVTLAGAAVLRQVPAAFPAWLALLRTLGKQGNASLISIVRETPRFLNELAGDHNRAHALDLALRVIAATQSVAAVDAESALACFQSSLRALRFATIGQFEEWVEAGLHQLDGAEAKARRSYFALETRRSFERLSAGGSGLALDQVQQTLRLYVEGLTGRAVEIAPLAAVPVETRLGDGRTIHLPSVVAEFGDEDLDFRLYKVLAAHGAGQIEFGTYEQGSPYLRAAFKELDAAYPRAGEPDPEAFSFGDLPPKEPADVRPPKPRRFPKAGDYRAVLGLFPNANLARRIFGTLENGRIDRRLRLAYRGLARDLDLTAAHIREQRPRLAELPPSMAAFELLFQIALIGGPLPDALEAYGTVASEIQEIVDLYLTGPDAGVADTLMATYRVYRLFMSVSQDQIESANTDQEDESDGEEGDRVPQLESEENSADERRRDVRELFNAWNNPDNETDPDERNPTEQWGKTELPEYALEEGEVAFNYDEWDRDLADNRMGWCRVIEKKVKRGDRSFVELARSRYRGVISSIRHQFQLMKPENLIRIQNELDGEDYDLSAVIDYVIDRRADGQQSERIYTKRLRRRRDVAVSFLLDQSSSTARTIGRHPMQPYTHPGRRIIEIEKDGLVLMSEALEAVGDVYSINGFTSEGRRNVKFYIIKDFNEGYTGEVEKRIGGITYQNNTRLGAAVRHAATRLLRQEARTRLLIVLSDGRPYDHDYGDSRYAREDTRAALRQAKVQGIIPFCITIDRESETELKDLYGDVGYTIIDDVLSLPERLPGIYRRLTT